MEVAKRRNVVLSENVDTTEYLSGRERTGLEFSKRNIFVRLP